MKKIVFLLMIIGLAWGAQAQQEPLFTQYMMNEFVINPAIAGTQGHFISKLNFRRQWVGMRDAPITQTLSAEGVIGSGLGLGGILYNDKVGPTRKTGLTGAFSMGLSGDEEGGFVLGINGGIFQYRVDMSQLTVADPTDQVIQPVAESVFVPDAGLGMYYFSEDYYIGLSVPHLIETNMKLSDVNRANIGKLTRHYFLYGGYKLAINDDFMIEPSVLFRAVANAPVNFDVNARFRFMNQFWVAASYRNKDAIAFMAGYLLNEQWELGYSYDYTTSNIKQYSSGSHEIMLGFHLQH